jgi:hypothetical protein
MSVRTDGRSPTPRAALISDDRKLRFVGHIVSYTNQRYLSSNVNTCVGKHPFAKDRGEPLLVDFSHPQGSRAEPGIFLTNGLNLSNMK